MPFPALLFYYISIFLFILLQSQSVICIFLYLFFIDLITLFITFFPFLLHSWILFFCLRVSVWNKIVFAWCFFKKKKKKTPKKLIKILFFILVSDGIKDGLQIGVTYRVGLASSLTVIRRRSRPTTTTSMEAATPPLSPTRQQGKKRRNFLTWGVGFFLTDCGVLWAF